MSFIQIWESFFYKSLNQNTTTAPMSQFYLYPLLLSQGYSAAQISQILHSYGLYSNYQHDGYPSPFLQYSEQSRINTYGNVTNFIIQQTSQAVNDVQYRKQNKDRYPDENQDQHPYTEQVIKQQPLQKQIKISQNEMVNESQQGKLRNNKKSKKNRIKKISLKEKREKQMKRNQTQNSKRNIIPNQIHQMLSILFKKKKSTHLVDKLIKKFLIFNSNSSISTQRFYLYQGLLKQKINHYANEQSLKILKTPLQPDFKIYSRQQQEIYIRIGLTLINYFLYNEATLIILNSQRIKPENKLDHLKTKRYLSYVLKDMINSGKQAQ